ncbi:MAG: DUF4276 family protein [Methylococcales bacterium]|nr:DUF4276 family protein [Methylococcales bacterium]MDP3839893.1 DUF4276 family protein [Methylococcales bacterium]
MYVVIAEDDSDFKCLQILIKRLAKDDSISIKGEGFNSCGTMLNKGAKVLNLWNQKKEYRKFIICYDRDKETAQKRYEEVISKIIKPAGIKNTDNLICILIPTEEIEAWILADIKAVSNVIPSWQPKDNYQNPEDIQNPKETLTRLSRINKPKPLYSHNIHNEKVMNYLNLEIIKKKCPSFAELANFVENNISNYPRISK